MKIGDLIEARSALTHVATLAVDPARRLKLKRLMKTVREELDLFAQARTDVAAAHNVSLKRLSDGRQVYAPVSDGDSDFQAFAQECFELMDQESTVVIEPILRNEDFPTLSEADLSTLEKLGIMVPDEEGEHNG